MQVERKTISIMKACELVGVSRRTIYNWLSAGKIEYVDTGISTDTVSVKEGQKLVVGRSSLDGPSTALFLLLTARIGN